MAAIRNRPQPWSVARPAPGGPRSKEDIMKRWLMAAVALTAAASIAATLGAAATKPYLGSWKAKVTADQLLDNGIAQPRFRGTWRLEFHRDGTYRAFNPWDKWFEGTYSADATRMVLTKDAKCGVGFQGPGVNRWKVTDSKLKLTSVKVDVCGGRRQTVSIPLWQRA
jgi:hypothetical protein